MPVERIFQVIVRGRFHELTKSSRSALVTSLNDHDVSRAAFTKEGTFTYDAQVDSFSLRYEIRIGHDEPADVATSLGLHEAEAFLGIMGIGHKGLRASATDMSDVWVNR
jgi:Family of unknown function (DUF6204)